MNTQHIDNFNATRPFSIPSMVRFLPFLVLVFPVAVDPNSSAIAGVLFDRTTDVANNDDFTGEWGEVNFNGFLNFFGFASDHVLVVEPSQGVTEYSMRYGGNFTSPTEAIHIELGFGTGENFVSAATVFPDLDFDAPFPSMPAPFSSVFPVTKHFAHIIEFSGGTADGTVIDASEFTVDVPDLPLSVNNFYSPDELPDDMPENAAAFTISRRVGFAPNLVPEPISLLLGMLALAGAGLLRRRYRYTQEC